MRVWYCITLFSRKAPVQIASQNTTWWLPSRVQIWKKIRVVWPKQCTNVIIYQHHWTQVIPKYLHWAINKLLFIICCKCSPHCPRGIPFKPDIIRFSINHPKSNLPSAWVTASTIACLWVEFNCLRRSDKVVFGLNSFRKASRFPSWGSCALPVVQRHKLKARSNTNFVAVQAIVDTKRSTAGL